MKTQITTMKRFALIGKLIKCNLLLLFIFFQSALLQAQAPEIEWQAAFGGNSYDPAGCVAPTSDGGYIVASNSSSGMTGNKSVAAIGGGDIWVIKLDNIGNIQWQKAYGGTGVDGAWSIEQTYDGGYIVGGESSSLPSGNKTALNYGLNDCWILKLDSNGDLEWQNSFGGLSNEIAYDVHQTPDGNYLIGAYSASGISGNKTSPPFGYTDLWVIKIDTLGNKIWEKSIGGSVSEYFGDLTVTADNGCIIGGSSNSPVSGNKTENTVGDFDYWVLKLNDVGDIEWQNSVGGNYTDELKFCIPTSDGGYFIGGSSNSPISGDKSEPCFTIGLTYYDYWVAKLKSNGDVFWENTIGANKQEKCTLGAELNNGTLVIGGVSTSDINGDKTLPRMSVSEIFDIWLVGLEPTGSIDWQNVLGGTQFEYAKSIIATNDGGFIISGDSDSGISGNKTVASFGALDTWVIKMTGDCLPSPELCNTLDDDCDGLIDEEVIEDIIINNLGSTTVCQGLSVSLVAEFTGDILQWFRNGSPIAGATGMYYDATNSGNYTCTTYSDCDTATSNTITVTVNKNPKAKIVAGGPTTFCVGDFVYLNELPTAGCSYQWQKDGANIPGATLNTYVATTTGIYRCVVTKIATGCFKSSNNIGVNVTCKTDSAFVEEISIIPNPANNICNIQLPMDGKKEVLLINAIGQIIVQSETIENVLQLNVSALPSGIYSVVVLYNNKMEVEPCIIE